MEDLKLYEAKFQLHYLTKILDKKDLDEQEQKKVEATKKWLIDNFSVAEVLRTSQETQPIEKTQGWWWPPNSRKAHYFVKADSGRSLCNGFLCFLPDSVLFREAEDAHHNSLDNCAKCKKLVANRQKREFKHGPLSESETKDLLSPWIEKR